MTEEQAIDLIRSGDAKGIDFLMKKYNRLLWKVADSVLAVKGSAEDAEECVADVFIGLWKKPEAYDTAKGKLSNWLCMRARCIAVDRLRNLMILKEEALDEIAEAGAEDPKLYAIEREEEYRELRRQVKDLPGKDQEIVIRRFSYGQKTSQIAMAMGLEKKEVQNRLYRIKQRLKKRLEKNETLVSGKGVRV